jgi:PAS domain S-box-containing protein
MILNPCCPGSRNTAESSVRELSVERTLDKCLSSSNATFELLKVLSANSFDSVVMTDASLAGRIIYANPAFRKLTGYDPVEVIGKTPRILQGPGTDPKVIKRLSLALRSGRKFEGKAINYRKDGTPFIMYWRVLPIRDGRKIAAWIAIQREGSAI